MLLLLTLVFVDCRYASALSSWVVGLYCWTASFPRCPRACCLCLLPVPLPVYGLTCLLLCLMFSYFSLILGIARSLRPCLPTFGICIRSYYYAYLYAYPYKYAYSVRIFQGAQGGRLYETQFKSTVNVRSSIQVPGTAVSALSMF